MRGEHCLNALAKIINVINKLSVIMSATVLGLLVFTVTYEIVARFIFNSPSIWTNEISTYLLQFLAFFSMGQLLIERKHVRVTFLIDKLRGLNRKLLEIFTVFLTIPYSVILVIYGFKFAENGFRVGAKSPTLLSVPLWIPYSFIMIAGILLTLAAISTIIMIAKTDYEDEKALEEANAIGGELL